MQSWSWTQNEPTATRTVIGGQGDGIYRMFRQVIDSGREVDMNRIIERFRDARDTDDPDELYSRGQETIDEGAAKAGLSLTLSETPAFKYGQNVRVGDVVTIQVGPGVTVTDVLTSATLSWTNDDGWKITPKVGDVADSTDIVLAQAINKLARVLSNQQRT